MRPIRLTMTAFGSFAEETCVRFDEFQSGLYLVVGETGAGKTTIFDAIVFALFGTASGSERRPDMMHSDYVEKSVDTVVTLTFDHVGKPYTVTRTIHYRKSRSGQYTDAVLSAELWSPDGAPLTGHTAVTKRCEELLGLNADQFKKIIMLAQGEFREFLSADAAKKSEILGRLFDSSEYVRFQTLLGAARSALADRRKASRETVELLLRSAFQPPVPEPGAEDEPYLPGDPRLLERLDALTERERLQAEALTGEKSAARGALDALHVKRGAAEGDNQKLDELKKKREHLLELEDRRGETEALSRRRDRGERAFRRVLPALEKHRAAVAAVSRTEAEIARLRQEAEVLRGQREKAAAELAKAEALEPRVRELQAERRRLEDSLPAYDEADREANGLVQAQREAEALRLSRKDKEAKKAQADGALADGEAELLTLEDAEARAVRAQSLYEAAAADAGAFTGKDSLPEGVKAAEKAARRLADDEAELRALIGEAADKEDRYHRLYRAFIGGQAGLLGAELEEKLRADGRAACPVCRSEFTRGEPHDFAVPVEGTPSQAQVDQAKDLFEKADHAREERGSAVVERRAALQSSREALLARAVKLLPDCRSWEILSGEGYLDRAAERFRQALAEAEARRGEAEARVQRRNALKKRRDELSAEAVRLGGELEELRARLQEAETAAAARTERVKALRDALPFPDRETAKERIDALSRESGGLEKQIEVGRNAFNAAREAADKADGRLSATEKSLPDLVRERGDAADLFAQALSDNGFPDREAFEDALPPAGQDPEAWLARQAETVSAWKNDLENTRSRTAELEEQTAELRYTDLEALDVRLRQAESRYADAEAALERHSALLRNHMDVREKAAASLGALAATDAAWARLDKLADLALGVTGEGGKLSFERYVMGSIFRQVLDMANRRLDVMSGGQYTLVHTTNAGRANAAAGLEIEVLDACTGRQRGPGSLSGGETFQVSLSLALGLSDVVQSRAGGMGLDAIFIDEGFGALDSAALASAISVLSQLTEGNRLVGVISHVDKLEESIPQKLRVKKTGRGSRIVPELS